MWGGGGGGGGGSDQDLSPNITRTILSSLQWGAGIHPSIHILTFIHSFHPSIHPSIAISSHTRTPDA